MVVNYKKSKIYKITNDVDNQVYIGSTTRLLCQRMGDHRCAAKNENEGRKLYKHMRQLGIEHFNITLLETFPCETKEQLLAQESNWINKENPSLNKNNASGIDVEHRKEYMKQYREKNKEAITLQTNKYKLTEKFKSMKKQADKKYQDKTTFCQSCNQEYKKHQFSKHLKTSKHLSGILIRK